MTARAQVVDLAGNPAGVPTNPIYVILPAGSVTSQELDKIGATVLTARDWSLDFAKLQNQDLAVTALRDALRGGSSKTLSDIVSAIGATVLAAGAATIGKVDQGVAGASPWLIAGAVTNTNLDIATSALRDALRGAGGKSNSDIVTALGAVVLAAGAANIGTVGQSGAWNVGQSGNWTVRNQDGAGNSLASGIADPAGSEQALLVRAVPKGAAGALTVTGAAAAAVTLTIPTPGAGLFQYVTYLEIEAYSTVARTGGVTPVLVTSTNLPGSLAWTFASAAAVGTTDTKLVTPAIPIKASVANTATTIVCPATTSVIWRVNAAWMVSA